MIPESVMDLTSLEEKVYPSTTYKLDLQTKRIGRKIDGLEAAIQAVTKILMTERYAHVIYSGDYGVELESLIGKEFEYVESDIRRRLEEAVASDDRIQGITELTTERSGKNNLIVNCTIQTVDGAFTISTEVET
jgi:phage baseplate assembly protein W